MMVGKYSYVGQTDDFLVFYDQKKREPVCVSQKMGKINIAKKGEYDPKAVSLACALAGLAKYMGGLYIWGLRYTIFNKVIIYLFINLLVLFYMKKKIRFFKSIQHHHIECAYEIFDEAMTTNKYAGLLNKEGQFGIKYLVTILITFIVLAVFIVFYIFLFVFALQAGKTQNMSFGFLLYSFLFFGGTPLLFYEAYYYANPIKWYRLYQQYQNDTLCDWNQVQQAVSDRLEKDKKTNGVLLPIGSVVRVQGISEYVLILGWCSKVEHDFYDYVGWSFHQKVWFNRQDIKQVVSFGNDERSERSIRYQLCSLPHHSSIQKDRLIDSQPLRNGAIPKGSLVKARSSSYCVIGYQDGQGYLVGGADGRLVCLSTSEIEEVLVES